MSTFREECAKQPTSPVIISYYAGYGHLIYAINQYFSEIIPPQLTPNHLTVLSTLCYISNIAKGIAEDRNLVAREDEVLKPTDWKAKAKKILQEIITLYQPPRIQKGPDLGVSFVGIASSDLQEKIFDLLNE